MVRIRFTQPDGVVRDIEAATGETLMAAAKAHGVEGVIAECGGSMVCGTCHVFVDDAWFNSLSPASDMEKDMLDCALDQQPSSRLSCQITLTQAMDGLRVRIPQSQR